MSVPFLQTIFRTEALSFRRWLGVAALSMVPLLVVEAFKLSGVALRVARWNSLRGAEAAAEQQAHEPLHPGG